MKKIYIKNFKGFAEQVIEIDDINFFVGENSTGKTSLITLINLLSTREFWITNDFNTTEIELGHFDEILTVNCIDNILVIGTEQYIVTNRDEQKAQGKFQVLLQFSSVKAEAKVDWVRFNSDGIEVFAKPGRSGIRYTYRIEERVQFEQWVVSEEPEMKPVRSLKFPVGGFPTFLLFEFIINEIRTKHKLDKSEMTFDQCLFFRHFLWLGPIRAKPKRIYESYNTKYSPEGTHLPRLLKTFLKSAKPERLDILKKFGAESTLFESILINELGSKATSPFEIHIKYHDTSMRLPSVGYGVAQILPLVIEILSKRSSHCFSIQQPEVHLHPRAQAAFGTLIFEASESSGHQFVIETHSDFTINRFRYCLLNRKTKSNFRSQILFFERKATGNKITRIPIHDDGSFEGDVPEEYRNFFIDEELRLLEM